MFSFRLQWYRVGAVGILCITLFIVCAGCSKTEYPQEKMSVVWETKVSAEYVWVDCMDTGAAQIELEPHHKVNVRPKIYVDPSGTQHPEPDLSQFVSDDWDRSGFRPLPDRSGWIAIDHDEPVGYAYIRELEGGGTATGSCTVRLNYGLRKINREGQVEWERSSLAELHIIRADNSIICSYGKDPAVLKDINREQMFSDEYAKAVLEKYAESPNVVQVLDGATGTSQARFEVHNSLTPISFLEESMFFEGPIVVAEERNDDEIRRLAIFSAADGEKVLMADWREVFPNINATQALVFREGIVVAGDNGSVSLLNHELDILWTEFPKGAKNNANARLQLLESSGAKRVAVATRFTPVILSPLDTEDSQIQLTVFDGNGNTLVTHGGLREPIDCIISGKVIATAKTGRTNTDYLYVFDLTGDAVKISRAEIPRAKYGPSVSPSGEYAAIKYKISDSEWEIVMYRLEGVQ
jgi:hypothetical protein